MKANVTIPLGLAGLGIDWSSVLSQLLAALAQAVLNATTAGSSSPSARTTRPRLMFGVLVQGPTGAQAWRYVEAVSEADAIAQEQALGLTVVSVEATDAGSGLGSGLGIGLPPGRGWAPGRGPGRRRASAHDDSSSPPSPPIVSGAPAPGSPLSSDVPQTLIDALNALQAASDTVASDQSGVATAQATANAANGALSSATATLTTDQATEAAALGYFQGLVASSYGAPAS